jgi:hypothetical protein
MGNCIHRTTNNTIFENLDVTNYNNINIDEKSTLGLGTSATVYKSQMKIGGQLQMVRFARETAENFILFFRWP